MAVERIREARDTRALGTDSVGRLLARFSGPAILAMLVGVIYNATDRWFISRYVGHAGMAALAVAMPLFLGVIAIELMTGIGGGALFSIRLGEGRPEEAERVLGATFALQVVLGLLFVLISLLWLGPLLVFLGAGEATFPLAREYMAIVSFWAVLDIVGYGLNHFIRALGYPMRAMFNTSIGAVMNIILDYVFMARMGMGMAGAALGTILGWSVPFVLVLRFLAGKKSAVRLRLENIRPDAGMMFEVFKFGLSPFMLHMSSVVVVFMINRAFGRYSGDAGIAAFSIAHTISMMCVMPVFGITQSMQSIAGFNFGAGKPGRVRHVVRLTLFASAVWLLLCWAVVQSSAPGLVGLFDDGSGGGLMEISARILRMIAMFMPLFGLIFVAGTLCLAIGRYKASLWFNIVRELLIQASLLAVFPVFWGLDGAMWAIPSSDLVCIMIAIALLSWAYKGLRRKG
ncbi:MAG: MATE family efflux transporter [Rickettsiales bacterium]|jgi:putative MATE family efflux protein|nr:MATE family efflux transporter [Rickettsiales bacterium]